ARDRPQEARGAPVPDPAAGPRARSLRTDLGIHLAERRETAGRRAGADGSSTRIPGRRRSKKCVSRKNRTSTEGLSMNRTLTCAPGRALVIAAASLCLLLAGGPLDDAIAQPRSAPARPEAPQTKPEGEMRWAVYVTMAQQWFDPGEVLGNINPFWFLYAMHDALVKPMPGNLMTPSLAESWTVSPDQ